MIDVFWTISHKFYSKGMNKTARVFELISMTISSHAISAKITVGEGTTFYHHGLGCVVLDTTHIGSNCKIFQNVTIGNTFSDNPQKSMGGVQRHWQ